MDFDQMKAIILAGGKGLRLREIIKDIPKRMAKIATCPFLEYLVLQFAKYNIKEIVISISYEGDVSKDYFRDGNSGVWR